MQDELAALRKRPAPTASAPTGGSQAEELAVLVERVKTLSGMVGENAGRLAAREGGLTELRSALTDEGARVDEALADVRRDIAALATRVAATAVRPAAAPPDERLHGKITALDDRIDGLASTVRETAGSVVATSGKLARTGEQVAALETTLETRSRETRAAITMLERELSSLRERAGADPRAQEGSRRLADAVQALGDRLDTVSGIVRESAGRLAAREEISIDLDRRLTRLAENVDALTEEVRRERDAVAPTASIAGEGVTAAELAQRVDSERSQWKMPSATEQRPSACSSATGLPAADS